jgi:CheY-like chemotaxis protein
VFNLNTLVLDLYKMLARLIGEEIELVSMVGDSTPAPIKADPGQIEQVLVNLVVNARDALPDGGRILLRTALVDVDQANASDFPGIALGEYVRLIVSDNGVGMKDDVKAKIFDPFFTTKEVGKGTGMGLSTCYGIVAQNDGFINVESTPGVGTSFYVYLPLVQRAVLETASEEGTILPKGTETVLIVEDEETVRDTAATILRDRGYEVLQASNGREALKVVEDLNGERIDVVVTDVVMPVMGGRELAEQLYLGHPETKIVFMSGYSREPFDRGDHDQQPVPDLIEKPFTAEALTRKVREVLDGG